MDGSFHSFSRLLARSTTFHYDQVANLMIMQSGMVLQCCWEDVDPFGSRPSFKLFLTISERRLLIRFQKFIANSTIVAAGLRCLHQGDDKVKFS
jgi:hypothetical protein